MNFVSCGCLEEKLTQRKGSAFSCCLFLTFHSFIVTVQFYQMFFFKNRSINLLLLLCLTLSKHPAVGLELQRGKFNKNSLTFWETGYML